jgi:hypothetical protein
VVWTQRLEEETFASAVLDKYTHIYVYLFIYIYIFNGSEEEDAYTA